MKRKALCFGLTVFLAITILVSACGKKEESPPIKGDLIPMVLNLVGSDPYTLDPHRAGDAGSAVYIEEIFGGLLTLVFVPDDVSEETLGGVAVLTNKALAQMPKDWQKWVSSKQLANKGRVAIAPDIAEEIPEPVQNADGTVSYTFKLRKGVRFHFGNPPREVTAEDIKYSFERAADPKTFSTTAELYLSDILGVNDKLRGRAKEVRGVEVLDDHTLRITIDSKKVYFLWKLTYPTAFVVEKTQVETNSNWTRLPNGTGPFKLVEWEMGRKIVLEKNPDYHLGAPKLDRVEFNLAGGSVLTMYEAGEVDIASIGTTDIERVKDPKDPLSREFIETPSVDIWYLGFNTQKPPFDDVKVRQAFSMAIDKEKLVKVVLKGMALVANGILPPGVPGRREGLSGLPFDPDKARELLSQSKYGSKEALGRLVLNVSGQGATAGPMTEAIVEMWQKNLGVEVELELTEWGTYLEDLKRGRYAMFAMGWVADYPDAEDFLDLKLHGDRSVANNEARYQNIEVDKLLEQARTEQDQAKRIELYQQAEDLVIRDAPWIPLIYSKNYVVVKPHVKGYVPTPMVIPILRFVEIVK